MAHPYKAAGHRNDPKWLGGLRRATGGGVSKRKSYTESGPEDYQDVKDENPTKTTTRFLPKYDFDYDPTGGESTGRMTEFGESPEVASVRGRMNNAFGSNLRGEPIRDYSDGFPQREDRPPLKMGGRVRNGKVDGKKA